MCRAQSRRPVYAQHPGDPSTTDGIPRQRFYQPINHEYYDPLIASFTGRTFDWDAIRKNCTQLYQFHGDNDPVVPLASAEELARHLGISVTVVHNAGHFNSAAGYAAFPLLLKTIRDSRTDDVRL